MVKKKRMWWWGGRRGRNGKGNREVVGERGKVIEESGVVIGRMGR